MEPPAGMQPEQRGSAVGETAGTDMEVSSAAVGKREVAEPSTGESPLSPWAGLDQTLPDPGVADLDRAWRTWIESKTGRPLGQG